MTIRVPAISTEFVQAAVRVDEGGVYIDPTEQPVWLAVVPLSSTPEDSDWQDGTWGGDAGFDYIARLLVSDMAPGKYAMWIRIDWGVESVRHPWGLLEVT